MNTFKKGRREENTDRAEVEEEIMRRKKREGRREKGEGEGEGRSHTCVLLNKTMEM